LACGYGSAVRSSVSSLVVAGLSCRGHPSTSTNQRCPPHPPPRPSVVQLQPAAHLLHLGGSPYAGPSHLGGSHRAGRCAVVHLIDFFLGRRQTTSRSSQQHGRRTGRQAERGAAVIWKSASCQAKLGNQTGRVALRKHVSETRSTAGGQAGKVTN
jgi:hypothetical protein